MGKCLACGREGYFSSSFKTVPTENGLIWCCLAQVMVASLRFILVQVVPPNRRRFLVKLAMMSAMQHRSFNLGYHSNERNIYLVTKDISAFTAKL